MMQSQDGLGEPQSSTNETVWAITTNDIRAGMAALGRDYDKLDVASKEQLHQNIREAYSTDQWELSDLLFNLGKNIAFPR